MRWSGGLAWMVVLSLSLYLTVLFTPKESRFAIENKLLRAVRPPPSIKSKPMQLLEPPCLADWRRARPSPPSPLVEDVKRLCRDNTSTLAIGSRRWYSAFHQPHFAEHFLFYWSVLLETTARRGPCQHLLMSVLEEVTEFWNDIYWGRRTWVTQLIHILHRSLGEFIISDSEAARWRITSLNSEADDLREKQGLWLFHPSDGAVLTSVLLNTDICHHLQASSTSANVTVLQRKSSRGILNLDEVRRTIPSAPSLPKSTKTSTAFFDSMSLTEQAQALLFTDLLVAVHGAGETNIVFMRPCSVVVEILPHGYRGPGGDHLMSLGGYFGSLARSLDIIFLQYMESKSNSILERSARTGGGLFSGNRRSCTQFYDQLPHDKDLASQTCMKSKYCRACARQANMVINTTSLLELVEKGFKLRSTCRMIHPAYSKYNKT